MPVFGMYLFFQFPTYLSLLLNPRQQWLLLAMFGSITFVLPALSTLLFVAFQKPSSGLQLSDRSERSVPLLITALYYTLGYYLFQKGMSLPLPLQLYFLGTLLAVVCNLLINRFYKISSHAIGAGGLFGGLLGFMLVFHLGNLTPLLLSVGIAGLVGFARLQLQAHTQGQLYAGYLLGFLAEYLLFAMVR